MVSSRQQPPVACAVLVAAVLVVVPLVVSAARRKEVRVTVTSHEALLMTVAVIEVAINSIDHNIQLQQLGTISFIVAIILNTSISTLSSGAVP